MARLLTAGFETGSQQEMNGATGVLTSASATTARTGSYSLKVHGGPIVGATGYQSHVFDANVAELYFRFALHLDANGIAGYPELRFLDENGDTQLTLYFNGATQTFKLYRGSQATGVLLASGTLVIRAATWYVLQGHLKIDNAAGEFELKINNVTDFAVSSADTQATAVASVRTLYFFGPVGPSSAEMYIDDVAVNDTAGSFQNTWIGLGGVYLLKPASEGATQDWTPSAGTIHWSLVDEVPAGTADWVQCGTAGGETELFGIETPPSYVASIDCVNVIYQVAVVESGSQALQDVVRQGTVDYPGGGTVTVVTVAPTYMLYQGTTLYEQPNGSGAWGTTEVAAIQIGVVTG